ncbi:hypothetical protein ILYODFUR_017577 [Ilyodon furcidens]|uniref:Uncharacterized protein n=1 Tax=Ilyodon furcidens TaxID=33524 RepID=A0ABV0U958_9TELE
MNDHCLITDLPFGYSITDLLGGIICVCVASSIRVHRLKTIICLICHAPCDSIVPLCSQMPTSSDVIETPAQSASKHCSF